MAFTSHGPPPAAECIERKGGGSQNQRRVFDIAVRNSAPHVDAIRHSKASAESARAAAPAITADSSAVPPPGAWRNRQRLNALYQDSSPRTRAGRPSAKGITSLRKRV